VCLAVLLTAGCAPKLPPEAVWEPEARTLLDQADGLFAKKQYEQASKTVDAFMHRYPASRSRDRALYLMGEIRFSLRDYAKALHYYKEIIQEFPASSFIIPARYKLGQCYFELKDYDAAIANLEDRSRITDPAQLKRIAEILSVAYIARKNYPQAAKEYAYLAAIAQTDQQKAGYRDRVREIVDKNLTEDELRTLADATAFPADLAQLRLAALLIEQQQYRDAIRTARGFLEKFSGHPEKTRAEMLLNDATARLTAPRYYLGALLPQSGQLALFGDRVLKGLQLAVHQYNLQNPDERVELLVKDTEGSPEKAAAALNELASKGIVAAIGPLLTKEAEAIAPMLEKLKVPVITPAASGEGIGKLSPWLFRNALTNSNQAAAAARFALGLKLKKFVIFHPDDAYGKDLARLFTRELERKAEILATVAYPPDVKDFGLYVRKVMETDLRSRKVPIPEDDSERKKLFQEYAPGFDALYLPGYAERVGLLIPQLAFYNISGIAMIGSNNWHSQDLIERAQRHAEGAVFVDGYFPESDDPAIKTVIEAYRSAYQEDPDILSAQAYDAAAMVLSFLKERKSSPQSIRDGLLALKDYSGITGATSFAGTGEAQKKLFLIKIQDGKFTLVTGEK
jgi:ABC-type branched-subunit amino acid transport system substrate-binding protein/outer membrane protein assembly factor BamD (BamD/ComL family)